MPESTKPSRILAVTGHRPNKLAHYYKAYTPAQRTLLRAVALAGLREIKPALVVTGMALGWDQAVAVACHELGIRYEAAVPFVGQESNWPRESQERYLDLMGKADSITIVSEGGYSAQKLLDRNKYMVDRSDLLLALWDGDKTGGTAHAVAYAQKSSKTGYEIFNSWDVYTEYGERTKEGA